MSTTAMKRSGASERRSTAPKRAKREANSLADIEDLFTPTQAEDIRRSLLEWYDAHHRILPWRRNPHSKVPQDPEAAERGAPLNMSQQQFMYWVWVCEVMSQQTQVPRAAEYFKRWVAKWPTVQDLAKATEEEVNEMWAGLGYYRRARYLLQGAKYVTNDLAGTFPMTTSELQKIPGVGPYTGAAMGSIAGNEVVAVVDANVMRVLARLRCLDWELKEVKRFSQVADTLVDPDRPGDFNQAVMELGARVCTVHQAADCKGCPIQQHCHAYQRETAAEGKAGKQPSVMDFPVKAVKPKKREEFAAVCVVQLHHKTSSSYLLVKRPGTGLLAGLWEFPAKLTDPETNEAERRDMLDGYLEEDLGVPLSEGGLEIVDRRHLGEVTHTFSHIRLTLGVERLLLKGEHDVSSRAEDPESDRPASKWIPSKEIAGEGLSSSVKKVLALVEKSSAQEKSSIRNFFARTRT